MKILKIEALVSCTIFILLGVLSLILGSLWLSENMYRVTGINYFVVFILTIGLIVIGIGNLFYFLYLKHEELQGYFYPER